MTKADELNALDGLVDWRPKESPVFLKLLDEQRRRPEGSNADEWQIWLEMNIKSGTEVAYMAVQIAEAIDDARRAAP